MASTATSSSYVEHIACFNTSRQRRCADAHGGGADKSPTGKREPLGPPSVNRERERAPSAKRPFPYATYFFFFRD